MSTSTLRSTPVTSCRSAPSAWARATSPSIASANSAPGRYVGSSSATRRMTAGRYGDSATHEAEALEVELDRAPSGLGAEDLGGELVQVGDRGVVELAHQRVAGGEVAVDRARADARPHGQLVEGRVDAALGEQHPRLDEEPLVVAPRIATRRCVRVHEFTVRPMSGMIRRVASACIERGRTALLGERDAVRRATAGLTGGGRPPRPIRPPSASAHRPARPPGRGGTEARG